MPIRSIVRAGTVLLLGAAALAGCGSVTGPLPEPCASAGAGMDSTWHCATRPPLR